jgi:hypothetical protein
MSAQGQGKKLLAAMEQARLRHGSNQGNTYAGVIRRRKLLESAEIGQNQPPLESPQSVTQNRSNLNHAKIAAWFKPRASGVARADAPLGAGVTACQAPPFCQAVNSFAAKGLPTACQKSRALGR